MVDESYLLLDWDSPSYSICRFQSIFRRQSLGLGRSFGTPRPRGPRPLALCFPRTSHQQFGVTSSFPSTPTFSESQLQILRDGSVRQLVWELLHWCHHRNIHIQVRHIPGKLNVLAYSLSRPNRILPTEWSLDQGIAHQIFKLLGYSSSGSLCHQIKPSAALVCFSSTGSQGLCSGCYVPRLEKPICICISFIQTCSPGSEQDKGFQQSVHSHSPVLTPEELVFSHSESHHRLSQGTSCSLWSGFTISRRSTT